MRRILIIIFILVTFIIGCHKEKHLIPVISRVSWITVHVRTQATFQSLYQLLKENLEIPVYFFPEKYGTASYTGIWAGDVILEICGPYPKNPNWSNGVMVRCNTLAFRPFETAGTSEVELQKRLINYDGPEGSPTINLKITELNTVGMPVNISDPSHALKRQQIIYDSLSAVLQNRNGGPLGFRYIEEIHIGYKSDEYLKKWKRFLEPLKSKGNLWHLPQKPNIRFMKSDSENIKALVFKVESLEKAMNYLRNNNMLGDVGKDMVTINKNTTKGLTIILKE